MRTETIEGVEKRRKKKLKVADKIDLIILKVDIILPICMAVQEVKALDSHLSNLIYCLQCLEGSSI